MVRGCAEWEGRGSILVVPVICECRHKYDLCIGFHKGENYLFARVDPDDPVATDEEVDDPNYDFLR